MTMFRDFIPDLDGWLFKNWREDTISIHSGNIFPWDLFQDTYLGVHGTYDPNLAYLDTKFYDEIYKSCAAKGNCGGLSLMALALYKYGGYMGFCGPANMHSGVDSPDDHDLHRALNILQARQFSAPGIENFVEIAAANNLNNAGAAYERVKEHLGSGDFCVLSLANDALGEYAHTVIPYKVEHQGTTQTIYIWDSNFPYDDYPDRYDTNSGNKLVINSQLPFEWNYQGQQFYDGAGGGWCFAVPMSKVIRKARHPFTLDMVFDQAMTLFVSGPGAAVAQITDESGRRYYRDDRDRHRSRLEIEIDPEQRMNWIVRWPGYAPAGDGSTQGELYFMRRPVGAGDLHLTLRGSSYQVILYQAGNLIECQVESKESGRDQLSIQRLATHAQKIAIQSNVAGKRTRLRQTRVWRKQDEWRELSIRELEIGPEPMDIQAIGDLQALEVSSPDRQLVFSLNIRQRINDIGVERVADHLTSAPGAGIRIEPRNWNELKKTKLDRSPFLRKGKDEQ